MEIEWVQKWPNHWLLRYNIGEETICISAFQHLEVGGEGLSCWIACLESPWVGGRWPLKGKNKTAEEARAEALRLAISAMSDAIKTIGTVKATLEKTAEGWGI